MGLTFEEFVNKYKDKKWLFNCFGLSGNPNLTWGIIKNTMNDARANWDWEEISCHICITWEIIKNNMNDVRICWDWWQISCHICITWEIIRDNPDIKWYWPFVSINPNITWEIIRDNPDYPWDYKMIFMNQNITPEIFHLIDKPVDWYYLSCNLSIRKKKYLKFIEDNINENWNFGELSKFIPLNIILKYINKPWYWTIITKYADFEEIVNNPVNSDGVPIPWDYYNITDNTTITLEILEKYKDKFRWDVTLLAQNPCINIEIVRKFIPMPGIYNNGFIWFHLSKNSAITWEDIQNNPDLPWVVSGICSNPNVSLDILDKYINHPAKPLERIDWTNISMNDFNYRKKLNEAANIISLAWRLYESKYVTKIQRWWTEIYYRPWNKASMRLYQLSI